MFQGIIPLLVIGGIVYAVVRHRSPSGPPGERGGAMSVGQEVRIPRLDEWVSAGLISAEQASALLDFERERVRSAHSTPRPHRRVPLVAEALGYLGGILGIVGLVMLIASYWDDMSGAIRLSVSAVGMVALAIAGFAVPAGSDAALMRLRWFLWTVSTAAAGVAGGVVVHDLMGRDMSRQESQVAIGVGVAISAVSGLLWWARERPVQQATMVGGAAVALGCAVTQSSGQGVTGLAVWGFGLMVVATGLLGLFGLEVIALSTGAIVTLTGAGIATDEWMGAGSILLVLSAASAVALGSVLAAVRRRDDAATDLADRLRSAGPTLLVVIGSLAMVQAVPMAAVHFADEAAIATGAVLWAVGVALVFLPDAVPVRFPVLIGLVGGLGLIVGPAVTSGESEALATIGGLITAIAAVTFGTLPGRVLLSLIGSVGLLVYVPWSISHFFPGEDRAPLLIAASGLVIVAVAVLVARSAGRVRAELGASAAR